MSLKFSLHKNTLVEYTVIFICFKRKKICDENLRPTLGPYVAVTLGDFGRLKATLAKLAQKILRL